MLRLFCCILPICLTLFSYAQGGWNIGYIPVDSLTKAHIGRVIRIDFKTPEKDKKSLEIRNIRSYVGKTDTGLIIIDTTIVEVTERRKIYVDHGSYNDQYLECINCKGLNMRLYDAEILDVDEQSILFKIEVSVQVKDSVRSGRAKKAVRIERAKLNGVMYQL